MLSQTKLGLIACQIRTYINQKQKFSTFPSLPKIISKQASVIYPQKLDFIFIRIFLKQHKPKKLIHILLITIFFDKGKTKYNREQN